MAAESPLARAFLAAGSPSSSSRCSTGAPVLVPVVEAVVVWFILNAVAERPAADAGGRARLPRRRRWRSSARRRSGARLPRGAVLGAHRASLGPRASGFRDALDPLVALGRRALGMPPEELLDRVADGFGLEAVLRQVVTGDGRPRQPVQHRRDLRRLPARRPAVLRPQAPAAGAGPGAAGAGAGDASARIGGGIETYLG